MDLRAPAPLFERIKGVERGFRALGAPGGLSALPGMTYARLALALGQPPTAGGRELVAALADARSRPVIAPTLVERAAAPCKEHVTTGADVDLLRPPTPFIHAHDGGRYLQTFGLNIVRTPDGSWTNWSINRMMLLDKNRLGCLTPPKPAFRHHHPRQVARARQADADRYRLRRRARLSAGRRHADPRGRG